MENRARFSSAAGCHLPWAPTVSIVTKHFAASTFLSLHESSHQKGLAPMQRSGRRAAAAHAFIISGNIQRVDSWASSTQAASNPASPISPETVVEGSSSGGSKPVVVRKRRAPNAEEASSSERSSSPPAIAHNPVKCSRVLPCDAMSPDIKRVAVANRRCCQMLERDGGMFGCELPSGHSGPHALDAANGTLRPNRQQQSQAQKQQQEQLHRQQEILRQVQRKQLQHQQQKQRERQRAQQQSNQQRQPPKRAPTSASASASASAPPAPIRGILPPSRALKQPVASAAVALEKPAVSAEEAWLQLEVLVDGGSTDTDEIERLYAHIEREGQRLSQMTYEQMLDDRAEFLAVEPKHPSGEKWGDDWPPALAAALRNAPVRKRHEVAGHSMLTCGKVVGCTDHFFQIVYENTHFESRAWHDLRTLLVPHPALHSTLSEAAGYLARATRRPKKKRDLDEECEKFLPREGCHYSLPPGKVACHLHEKIRLSGLVPYDMGPAPSD